MSENPCLLKDIVDSCVTKNLESSLSLSLAGFESNISTKLNNTKSKIAYETEKNYVSRSKFMQLEKKLQECETKINDYKKEVWQCMLPL